jgi:hypothetical protein
MFPLHQFLKFVPQGNKWDLVERVLTKRWHDLDAIALPCLNELFRPARDISVECPRHYFPADLYLDPHAVTARFWKRIWK